MGPDTEQHIKAIREQQAASNEALNLLRAEVEGLKKGIKSALKHVTAQTRANAAYHATYDKNMKED